MWLFIHGSVCSPQLNGTADRHRESLSLITHLQHFLTKILHDHHVIYLIESIAVVLRLERDSSQMEDPFILCDFGLFQTKVDNCDKSADKSFVV